MKNFFVFLFVVVTFLILISCEDKMDNENSSLRELKTVEYVDINQYLGTWYEIAKIPNRFQAKCKKNTKAIYDLKEESVINIRNICVKKNGKKVVANGIAKIVDKRSNARLKVSFVNLFGISLFWGDYWIIDIDKNYRYAVVGTPSRKYGWVLSRTKKLSSETLNKIYGKLKINGYNPDDFETTLQE